MLSVEDKKDQTMIIIQTEEINQFVTKNVNPTTKQNQYLWDDLGTVIPSTPEQIGGRPRIYHQVSDIQLLLAVHQVQDVYVWN